MRAFQLALLVQGACFFLAGSAGALEAISFDEIPAHNSNRAALSEEYAHLGVHFVATDDGAVWDGMSNGDPGGWSLEGTHGPSFVGFNGRSFELWAWFDAPVPALSLDVSSSGGAEPGTRFVLEGYRDGAWVETVEVVLGGANEWMTVSLSSEVDEVHWFGENRGFHPFGVDNLRWGLEAPAHLEVAIDVMPGNRRNPLNPGSSGVVVVALLGSEDFDVADVDVSNLRLGLGEAEPEGRSPKQRDVNGDGWTDLVAHYRVADTQTAYGDESICLAGETLGGVAFGGCDAIRTVPGRR